MTIQRPHNCPTCGAFYPMTPSWFDVERLNGPLERVKDWDPELVEAMQTYGHVTVEHADGDWVYHITKARAVNAYPISVLKIGHAPTERVGKTWRQRKASLSVSTRTETK